MQNKFNFCYTPILALLAAIYSSDLAAQVVTIEDMPPKDTLEYRLLGHILDQVRNQRGHADTMGNFTRVRQLQIELRVIDGDIKTMPASAKRDESTTSDNSDNNNTPEAGNDAQEYLAQTQTQFSRVFLNCTSRPMSFQYVDKYTETVKDVIDFQETIKSVTELSASLKVPLGQAAGLDLSETDTETTILVSGQTYTITKVLENTETYTIEVPQMSELTYDRSQGYSQIYWDLNGYIRYDVRYSLVLANSGQTGGFEFQSILDEYEVDANDELLDLLNDDEVKNKYSSQEFIFGITEPLFSPVIEIGKRALNARNELLTEVGLLEEDPITESFNNGENFGDVTKYRYFAPTWYSQWQDPILGYPTLNVDGIVRSAGVSTENISFKVNNSEEVCSSAEAGRSDALPYIAR